MLERMLGEIKRRKVVIAEVTKRQNEATFYVKRKIAINDWLVDYGQLTSQSSKY